LASSEIGKIQQTLLSTFGSARSKVIQHNGGELLGGHRPVLVVGKIRQHHNRRF
jgi:hypothetical protein